MPTMFRDPDLELDREATRRGVRFILDGGMSADNAVLLAGGAAGDFSTMTFDERVRTSAAAIATGPSTCSGRRGSPAPASPGNVNQAKGAAGAVARRSAAAAGTRPDTA